MRKLNTNKTQILHRIRLRKYNPEKPPEDNHQETQWQVDDNIVVPQDDPYTIAWEAELGGHLFDIPIIYTHPNAIDFDDRHTQGPDTVIIPRSYFHELSNGQNRETCPISDPSVPQTPKPKLNGQSQDIETTTDLTQNDNAKHIYESITDAEITCKPVTQHHQRRVTLLQRLTATILQLKVFTKRNLITLEAANTTYAPIPILFTQKYTDIDVCKNLF